jgi:hypothetical protein
MRAILVFAVLGLVASSSGTGFAAGASPLRCIPVRVVMPQTPGTDGWKLFGTATVTLPSGMLREAMRCPRSERQSDGVTFSVPYVAGHRPAVVPFRVEGCAPDGASVWLKGTIQLPATAVTLRPGVESVKKTGRCGP